MATPKQTGRIKGKVVIARKKPTSQAATTNSVEDKHPTNDEEKVADDDESVNEEESNDDEANAESEDEEEVEKWEKSEAKKLLREDICTGVVTDQMSATTVYAMQPLYKDYDIKNFTNNLKNLRAAIAKDYARMLRDCEMYGHDLGRIQEFRAENPHLVSTKPRWFGSEAEKLLLKDLADKRHLVPNFKPKQLFEAEDRAEYRKFSLLEFRSHLYKEIKKAEKQESKLRFDKKKLRTGCPANWVVGQHHVAMIKEHNALPPKKEKKKAPPQEKKKKAKVVNATKKCPKKPPPTNNAKSSTAAKEKVQQKRTKKVVIKSKTKK